MPGVARHTPSPESGSEPASGAAGAGTSLAGTSQPVEPVLLDGRTLTCGDVERVARLGAGVHISPSARARVAAAHDTVLAVSARRPVYGFTTGVGANRQVPVAPEDVDEHGLRLLRSHAACVGPVDDVAQIRATLAVRLNEILAGGAGLRAEVVDTLAEALVDGSLPTVHRYGAVGTGDLAPLAEIAMTLVGELPWQTGGLKPLRLGPGEALAFLSSNAVTIAAAALANVDLTRLLRASHVVAALSFLALEGSPETYADPVHQARAHPGQVRAAAEMRRLLGPGVVARHSRRIQDPFGLRTLPQVHGAALDALDVLERVLSVELNAAAENPLVSTIDNDVFHHGQFHTAVLASGLDQVRIAVHPVLALSAARLGALVEPTLTGLPAFLADGPSGSSGVMILEYVAQDVVAEVRQTVLPVTIGAAVLSRGLEEHASFSSQSARLTATVARTAPLVLACELVVAIRALRQAPDRLVEGPIREVFDLVAAALSDDLSDRPLGADVDAATALLPTLAEL